GKWINMYINSPGGGVYAGLGIYDAMQYIKSPVRTICTGLAASMGAFLLAAGEPGHRLSLPHSRIMVHQPSSGGIQGTAADILISAQEILYLRDELDQILAENTSQPLEKIRSDRDRDLWFSAQEAKDYGLIDRVIELKPRGSKK